MHMNSKQLHIFIQVGKKYRGYLLYLQEQFFSSLYNIRNFSRLKSHQAIFLSPLEILLQDFSLVLLALLVSCGCLQQLKRENENTK